MLSKFSWLYGTLIIYVYNNNNNNNNGLVQSRRCEQVFKQWRVSIDFSCISICWLILHGVDTVCCRTRRDRKNLAPLIHFDDHCKLCRNVCGKQKPIIKLLYIVVKIIVCITQYLCCVTWSLCTFGLIQQVSALGALIVLVVLPASRELCYFLHACYCI